MTPATHVRHHRSLLAAPEKRLLVWIAHRMPRAIHSDHLTLLALGAMAIAGAAFATARFHPLDGRIYVGQRSGTKGLYRVEGNDALTPLWTGDDIAGIAIDPSDGAVYAADDFSGEVFRTPFLAAGRTTWVTGWHADDDDPIGLAIAPPGSTNGIVAPGEALMVDRGSSGLDEIWRWSPATAEGEAAVHVDDGTLIDAVDVAIGPSGVWVVDTGGAADGAIYEVQAGGALAPRSTSEPLAEPSGIAWDPLNDGLLVLDGVANGRGRRVVLGAVLRGRLRR